MNKPKFLVRIKGKEFSCLGSQLGKILEIINEENENYIWYGADVEINGRRPFKLGLEGWTPKKIGNIKDLVKLCKAVDQFLSGLFFALPLDQGKTWVREFSTEDEAFRDMEEAIFEIRAFDTTYFEVYSNILGLMKKLSQYFSVAIEEAE